MRLITLNARDYRLFIGTPYSDSDSTALRSLDFQNQQSTLRACGRELGASLVRFIEQGNVSPMSMSPEGSPGLRGGILVLGRSFGSAITFILSISRRALGRNAHSARSMPKGSQVGFGEHAKTIRLSPQALTRTRMLAAILSAFPKVPIQ